MKEIKKYCKECGRKVDLRKRKSIVLGDNWQKDVPNPEYRFICYRCADEFRKRMKMFGMRGWG